MKTGTPAAQGPKVEALGPGMQAILRESQQTNSLVDLLQRRLLEAGEHLEAQKAENARLKISLMTTSTTRVSPSSGRPSLEAIVSSEDPRVAELKTTVEMLRSDVDQLTAENAQLQRVREDAAIVSALRVQLEAARAENENLKAKIRQELLPPQARVEQPTPLPADARREELERELERAIREHFGASDENVTAMKERFLRGLEDLRQRIEEEVRQENGEAVRENKVLKATQKAYKERLGVLEVEMEALRNQVKRMRGLMDLAEAERKRAEEDRQKAEIEAAKVKESAKDTTKQLATAARDRDASRHELQTLKMTLDAIAAERDSLESQLLEERERSSRKETGVLDADDLPAILRGAKLSLRARDVAHKAKDVDGLTELLQAASDELQRARDEAAMERAASEALQRAAAEMRAQCVEWEGKCRDLVASARSAEAERLQILDDCARWRAAAERLQASILHPSPRRHAPSGSPSRRHSHVLEAALSASRAASERAPSAPGSPAQTRRETPARGEAPLAAPPVSLPAAAAGAALTHHSTASSPGATPARPSPGPRASPANRSTASSRPASAPSSASSGKVLWRPGGSYHVRLRDMNDPISAAAAADIDTKVEELTRQFADAGVTFELQRVGPGQYKFGARKLKLRIVNGKLMVRVGGGYCSLYEGLLASGTNFLGAATSSPPRT